LTAVRDSPLTSRFERPARLLLTTDD